MILFKRGSSSDAPSFAASLDGDVGAYFMRRIASRYGPSREVLAGRIRTERLRLGLTAEQAGKRLGVSRTTYSQLEEAADPKLSTLIALATAGFRVKVFAHELFSTVGYESVRHQVETETNGSS